MNFPNLSEDFECVLKKCSFEDHCENYADEEAIEALARIRTAYDDLRTTQLNSVPYKQGFRDALLSTRAAFSYAIQASVDATALAQFVRNLDALIDQKNHDLWNLFAVARVDLSAYPEAQALRSMLRAPSGVLIDSAGRMLFVRMNGTEYDTGVLALLGEVARLKAAAEPEMFRYTVNGIDCVGRAGMSRSYEECCAIAGFSPGASVTFHGEGDFGTFLGNLIAGTSIIVAPTMAICVGNAASGEVASEG